MRRWLYTYEYVNGDPEGLERRLLAETNELVRRSFGGREQEIAVDGSFLLDLPSEVAGFDVAKQVRLRTGVAHRSGTRVLIPVAWRAEPGGRAFPAFEGQLELEAQSSMHVQLSLVGSYGVPMGPLGAMADAAVLHRVAERTAEQVLQGVARELSKGPSARLEAHAERRWPLRVRDVMTPDPIVLDPQLPLKTAALLLFHAEVSGAPVVAEDGTLVGVLSERDLLAKEAPVRFGLGRSAAQEERRQKARTVADACSSPAAVAVPDARLADAARDLLDRDISRLVVIDEGRVVGIMSRHDVLAALVRDDADLYTAVGEALGPLDADGVRVEVSWGDVTLAGTVELRSVHEAVIKAVREVDGVMNVDAAGLVWERDDIVPVVPFS
jgi:CBS domain-containing protein